MGNLILKSLLNRQPQYPVEIDYVNPIANGLQFAWAGGPWAATPSGLFAPSAKAELINSVRGEYGGIRGVQCADPAFAFPTAAGSGINGATQATIFGLVLRTTDHTQAVFNRNTSGDRLFELSAGTFGEVAFYISASDFSNQRAAFTKTFTNNKVHSIAVAWDGPGSYRGYSDGINLGAASITGSNVTTYPASTEPSEIGNSYAAGNGGFVYLSLVWNRALSEGEILRLTTNPWQIFKKRQQILYFGGTGAHALAGAAASVATATGALSIAVPLAGAAVSAATATGALSVSIPLAGAAQAVSSASGTLSTTGTVDLAGAATATANATGGLSLSIPLSGAAVAQALASAGLTQGVPLVGAAAAVAAASGALSISVSLSGSAIAEAAASAGLSVTSASSLAGAAQAQAAASGALSLAIPLSGAALTVASASGGLTHIVPLSGSAAAASLATGGLDVSVKLSGAALAEALASAGLSVAQSGLAGAASGAATATGTLTLRVNLDGAAVANAIAAGALSASGLILAGTPGFKITATARSFRITRAARTRRTAS